MARLSPFGSSAVVEVADELVGRYKEQGWTVIEEKPKATAKAESKPSKKK